MKLLPHVKDALTWREAVAARGGKRRVYAFGESVLDGLTNYRYWVTVRKRKVRS